MRPTLIVRGIEQASVFERDEILAIDPDQIDRTATVAARRCFGKHDTDHVSSIAHPDMLDLDAVSRLDLIAAHSI
jgi:hypothetical protein